MTLRTLSKIETYGHFDICQDGACGYIQWSGNVLSEAPKHLMKYKVKALYTYKDGTCSIVLESKNDNEEG